MYVCESVHGQHGGGAGQGRGRGAWSGQQWCVDGEYGEEQLIDPHGGRAADEPHLWSSAK